jgi:hypothetical protein
VKKLPKKPAASKPGAAPAGALPAKKGAVKKVSAPSAALKKSTAEFEKKPATRKAKPGRLPRSGVPFICSECYEEFVLPSTYSRETVTCPECLHVGKRPAEDFLRTVTVHKAGEKSAFKLALMSTYFFLVSALLLIWIASPYSSAVIQDEGRSTGTMILLILVVGSAGLLIWASSRYEKNRWEVYF